MDQQRPRSLKTKAEKQSPRKAQKTRLRDRLVRMIVIIIHAAAPAPAPAKRPADLKKEKLELLLLLLKVLAAAYALYQAVGNLR